MHCVTRLMPYLAESDELQQKAANEIHDLIRKSSDSINQCYINLLFASFSSSNSHY